MHQASSQKEEGQALQNVLIRFFSMQQIFFFEVLKRLPITPTNYGLGRTQNVQKRSKQVEMEKLNHLRSQILERCKFTF